MIVFDNYLDFKNFLDGKDLDLHDKESTYGRIHYMYLFDYAEISWIQVSVTELISFLKTPDTLMQYFLSDCVFIGLSKDDAQILPFFQKLHSTFYSIKHVNKKQKDLIKSIAKVRRK